MKAGVVAVGAVTKVGADEGRTVKSSVQYENEVNVVQNKNIP